MKRREIAAGLPGGLDHLGGISRRNIGGLQRIRSYRRSILSLSVDLDV